MKLNQFKTEHHKKSKNDWLKKEINLGSPALNNRVKEAFYVELSVLMYSGINLVKAIEIQTKEQAKESNKNILLQITNFLVEGNSLYQSLEKLKKYFSSYEIISVKIGEETGSLALIFERLGAYYKKKNEQTKQLKSAMTYPIVIMCTAFLSILFMLKFVVPMFADIFKQNKLELPWITQKIVSVSNFVSDYIYLLLVGFVGLFIVLKLLLRLPTYKAKIDQLFLHVPIVAGFVKKNALLQFTQTLSLLTAAKVPVLTSIQLILQMVTFHPLKHGLHKVEKKILSGGSLSDGLSEHSLFDSRMLSLIKVAEETNQNDYVFERLSQQYANELDAQSKNLSTIMEPLIIVVLGGVVAIVLVAMYLPMFKLSSVLG